MYNSLNDNDFVYYKDEHNNIFSGGYKITNNRFLENDIAPMIGGKFIDKLGNKKDNLVIPYSLCLKKMNDCKNKNCECDGITKQKSINVISENIYDEFLKILKDNKSNIIKESILNAIDETNNNNRHTRKNKKIKHKKSNNRHTRKKIIKHSK